MNKIINLFRLIKTIVNYSIKIVTFCGDQEINRSLS